MNDWAGGARGVGARSTTTPAVNGKIRATILDDTNALFRQAVEAVPAAVYMTDAHGRLTFYNDAAATLWGCRPELGETKFCGSWKLYWPDGTPLPPDECPMAMALQQRRPIRGMEAVAERPDGTRVPFIPYPTPLFDASGDLTGAVNMLLDISERKRAEAVLQERNAQFELVSRVALIGSYSYDYRTRLLNLSRGCAAMYGLPEDIREITQKNWRAFVHPDDLPRIDAMSVQALAQRQSELVLEFRIIRSDRKQRWIEARILVTYDDTGQAVQMLGANIDVTERKQTAQDLAERTVQLALAGKAALVGSYAYDTDTEIMQVSEGYAAIHGLPEGTVEVARNVCLATVHPEDIGRVRQLRDDAFDLRRREYSVEYRIIRTGGEIRWVESRCFITYVGEGRPHRVIGVSIDITGRKRVEEQQRKLVAELDHRVKNVLATVQAVAAHTMDASSSMQHFVTSLEGRLQSLKLTHEILSHRGWLGIPLEELVRRELAPYATGSNAEISGPEVMLSAEAGQTIGMVLHELATNAAKYGALSAPSGRVSIRWRLAFDCSASDRLILKWRETNGPSIASASKSSYGMNVVRELIPYELGGTVDYVLSPEGAQCQVDIPLDRLRGGSAAALFGDKVGATHPAPS
jgi:PAS domain S-box-containing protein